VTPKHHRFIYSVRLDNIKTKYSDFIFVDLRKSISCFSKIDSTIKLSNILMENMDLDKDLEVVLLDFIIRMMT